MYVKPRSLMLWFGQEYQIIELVLPHHTEPSATHWAPLVKMDEDCVERSEREGQSLPQTAPLMRSSALAFCAASSGSLLPPVMWREYHSGDREEPSGKIKLLKAGPVSPGS